MVDKIFQALQQVKMPVASGKLEANVRRAVRKHAGCRRVVFREDYNPRIEVENYLNDDIKYVVEHHTDTLVCDGREFEVEAVYELYVLYCCYFYYVYYIVHSFKPIRVQERRRNSRRHRKQKSQQS